jgi:hypothetical protein
LCEAEFAQIALEIEDFASLPRALGGLGVGILNAADDLAGGGAALTRGARQAARQLDDEWVRLYRAVSPEEVDDLMKSGRFRPHPEGLSTEGKWFTTTPEYAAAWAKKHLYRRKPYWVVEAKVRQSVLSRMFHIERLDRIGSGYYAYPEQLPYIRFVGVLNYIPWLP